uniref:Uncharacterized protein n=1 Tax=Neisseria meningitidis alpha522 TaxID=996307 RepID=I4E3F8_NEIME|nr:hypothetical protein NMALPHA522_0331 [Neisseria meningitidis alpha522]
MTAEGFLVFPKMHIIQIPLFPQKQKIKNSNLKSRPSRAGGNLNTSVVKPISRHSHESGNPGCRENRFIR